MTNAVYPGTFDPVTYGHLDIIRRASLLYNELIIGVLHNSSKTPLFSVEERVNILKIAVKDIPNVRVESFQGLSVDFAKKCGAKVIVRGLRLITDFEYELQMAQANRDLYPDMETMFLATKVEYSFISSTIVKEILRYGGNIRHLVPKASIEVIESILGGK